MLCGSCLSGSAKHARDKILICSHIINISGPKAEFLVLCYRKNGLLTASFQIDFVGLAVSRKKESHTPVDAQTLPGGGGSRMGGSKEETGAAEDRVFERRCL